MRPLLLLALAVGAAAQPTLVPLTENGPPGERLNVVVVAEGYTDAQRDAFARDAADVAASLFAVEPYDRYGAFFNTFALFVASDQDGADHPSRNVFRATAFGAAYDCAGIQRLICLSGPGQSSLTSILRDLIPEYDVVLVLVNDPEYGGSGGSVSVASVHPLSAEIAIHEIGHTFAGLADEYGGTQDGFTSINTTTTTARDAIPWRVWIDDATPVPTPESAGYDAAVGLFEGAAYADIGAYRPQHLCRMRTLGVSFCAVCHEYHIGAIYDRVSPISAVSPAEAQIEVGSETTLTFQVDPLVPADRLAVEWTVGGVTVEAEGTTLDLSLGDLPEGVTEVEVRVADLTAEVREPSLRPLLEERHTWTVTRRPTGVEAASDRATRLGAVLPNPIRSSARLTYELARAGRARLTVLDVLGRIVTVVEDAERPAGPHEVAWSPSGLPAGVYLVRLEAAGVVVTRAVTVAR